MIGYKAISQFSFDDCVYHIEHSKQNGFNPDADVEKLYSSLLNDLLLKDDALYEENKTSLYGCRKYIKTFPIEGAKSYKARHIDEAKQLVDKFEKRNQIGCLCLVAVLFVIFTIWGVLTYKPQPNLSLQDDIVVSQYGDTILLSNYLQGTDNRTKIYIEDIPEFEVDSTALGYNVYRNDRHDYYDLGKSQSSDYMDLSWPKKIYLHKKYIIPMNCSQNIIKKRVRIETYSEIFGLKIETKTNYIKIQQHGGGATFMYKTEWYKPNFNANGRIDVNVDNNGIRGNSYPVFLHTDGTYVNVQISDSWITVEKRDDVEGDSYNFHIRVEENRTSDKRIGTVKFSSGDKYIEYVLSQAKGYATRFEVDKEQHYVTSDEVWEDGGEEVFYEHNYYLIKIYTDGIWDYNLCDEYGWIKAKKCDNGIRFMVRENKENSRTARITISTLNMGAKTVNITQLGEDGKGGYDDVGEF